MANQNVQNVENVKLQRSLIQQAHDGKGRPTVIVDRAPGDVIQLPANEAQRFIERGYAVAIDSK